MALTIIMSILNANFDKNKQFHWAYLAKENSMNKDIGSQVNGVYKETYVDTVVVVGTWGVFILALTSLDFHANLGQMEMAPVMFSDLPGILIFWYSVLNLMVLSCWDHSLYWPPWWPLQWRRYLRQACAGTL